MKEIGIIFNIKKFAIHDGPGIRTTIFLKGCPLRCWWCHNPEGLRLEPQKITIENKNEKEKLASWETQEIIGREMSVNEIMEEIKKDIIFYEESNGGVTFSGGEPLMQLEFLYSLLHECKKQHIHTALDTSGYSSLEDLKKINNFIDLYLYDLKIMEDQNHIKYTGVSNKQIIKNLKYLSQNGKQTLIRIPIIPEITDTAINITQLGEFISSLNNVKRVNLLPYHRIGKNKYDKLKMEYKMKDIQSPTNEKMEEIKNDFENFGFQVKIGG